MSAPLSFFRCCEPLRHHRDVARLSALLLVTAFLSVGQARAAAPRRVVSLAPSVTEIVFALGAGDRLVGVSAHCDHPPAARHIERVGTFLQPDIERILAKRPDLVIAVPSPENRRAVERIAEFGLAVRVVRPEKIEEVFQAVETIAADLDVGTTGAKLVAEIRAEIAAIERRVAGRTPPRVLMVVGRRPLIAVGAGTYQDELIARAGGFNVAATSGEPWPHLSLERVVIDAPEVIVDTGMGPSDADESIEFWKPLATIPAVRDERIVGAGRLDLLRPGPRIGEALEAMARFIHPEAFAAHP